MNRQSLADLAFNCLRLGRQFGHACSKVEFPIPEDLATNYKHLHTRLLDGRALCLADLQTAEQVAQILKDEMNDIRAGYGDRAFSLDTDEDLIFDKELELRRRAAESYKALIHEYNVLKDRFTARRWTEFKVGKSG